jgi:hypothetical protein
MGTGRNKAVIVKRLGYGCGKRSKQITRQRILKPPRNCHRQLSFVAYVSSGPQKVKRPFIAAIARE